MARRRWWLAFVIALTACGGSADRQTVASPAPDPAPSSAVPEPVPAVPAVLDFQAPLVGGGQFDARAYAGQSVALWFWAPY